MSFGYQILGFGAFPNRGADSYQPAGALWLDGSADYLHFTPSTPSNQIKWTISFWAKQGVLETDHKLFNAGGSNTARSFIQFDSADTLTFGSRLTPNPTFSITTTPKYKDTTAWANYVVVFDSANGTEALRLRIFRNGVEQANDGSDFPGSSEVSYFNTSGTTMRIGTKFDASAQFYNGYLADVIMLDNYASTDASEFGETDSDTGIWVPKDPSDISSFGNNGFWLNFADGRYPGLDVHSSATGDADFGVKHLMHFDGDDGDDGDDDVTDDGLSAATLSFTGNAQLDTSIKKFGDSSLLLDGSGDKVSFTCPVFGTDSYTIDFWIYPLSSTHDNAAIMGNRGGTGDDCLIIYFKSGSNNRVVMDTPMSNIHLGSSSTELSINTWYHIAFTFDGVTNRQFINGTLVDTTATSFNLNRVETWRIGHDDSGNKPNDLNGHIDELRIVHGVCKWTTSFTPETSAYSNPTKNNSFIPSSIGANNIVATGPANSTDKEVVLYGTWDASKPMTGSLSADNLTVTPSADKMAVGSIPFDYNDSSGVYIEIITSNTGTGYVGVIHSDQASVYTDTYTPGSEHRYQFHSGTGTDQINDGGGSESNINAGVTWGEGDVIQIAVKGSDIWFGKNNTWVNNGSGAGNPSTGANPCFTSMGSSTTVPVVPYVQSMGSGTCTFTIRNSTDTFSYTPPTGFNGYTKTVTGVGNAATWNSIKPTGATLTGGNTVATIGTSTTATGTIAFDPADTDGYYWEYQLQRTGAPDTYVGVTYVDETIAQTNTGFGSQKVFLYTGYTGTNNVYTGHTTTTSEGALSRPTWGTGDTVGVAVKAGKLYYSVNGTWIEGRDGTSASATFNANHDVYDQLANDSDSLMVPIVQGGGSTTAIIKLACAKGDLRYAIPTGMKTLESQSMPESTVTEPSAYFQTSTWSGNNDTASSQAITFSGHSDLAPDMVWVKSRGTDGRGHVLVDRVRGLEKVLTPNSQAAEYDDDSSVTAFGVDGFTVDGGSGSGNSVNDTGDTYVGWAWKAGGNPSTTSPAGTIASSTSVASHGGFSIGTYTGDSSGTASTIGHGLSRKPSWIIVKNLDNSAQSWTIWHENLYEEGVDKYMSGFNNTNGMTNGAAFNSVEPSPTLFTVGNNTATNAGADYVFYAFARTPGAIASGKYTGNGNADGPYVIVDDGGSGFRPAFLLLKKYEDSSGNSGSAMSGTRWIIVDSVRDPQNPTTVELWVDGDVDEETASRPIDFTSTGFKLRAADSAYNDGKFIYLAFAEQPFPMNNRAR